MEVIGRRDCGLMRHLLGGSISLCLTSIRPVKIVLEGRGRGKEGEREGGKGLRGDPTVHRKWDTAWSRTAVTLLSSGSSARGGWVDGGGGGVRAGKASGGAGRAGCLEDTERGLGRLHRYNGRFVHTRVRVSDYRESSV